MTSSKENSWQEVVELAEHYKAIGMPDVSLWSSDDDLDRPWDFVALVEPGGSGRYSLTTSVYVSAPHPCGITFRWSIRTEKRDSNGTTTYKVDTNLVSQVLTRLPEGPRRQYQNYLLDCATSIEEQGQEHMGWAQTCFGQAMTLRALGKKIPEVPTDCEPER